MNVPNRIIFSLQDLHAWGNADHHNSWEIDWRKPTVILGDGPSRNDWIWNPKKVNLFAINQACLWTACPFVTSRQHFDELLSFELPVEIPAVLIDWKEDSKIYKSLQQGANGPAFLSFILQITKNENIYLQGFDCREYNYRDYDFRRQIFHFKQDNRRAKAQGIKISSTTLHGNPILYNRNEILVNPPPVELVLDQWPGVNFDTPEAILDRMDISRVANWFRWKYKKLDDEKKKNL